MTLPLMQKATTVWLIDNTGLSFEQIADFCGMHHLEVKAIADGEVAVGIKGIDPIYNNQLTKEEIARCEKDPKGRLQLTQSTIQVIEGANAVATKRKYTPEAMRENKPNAIAWLLKNCPELSHKQIAKLVGSTLPTVTSIKSRTHWNMSNITSKDPVLLGICSRNQLDEQLEKAKSIQTISANEK